MGNSTRLHFGRPMALIRRPECSSSRSSALDLSRPSFPTQPRFALAQCRLDCCCSSPWDGISDSPNPPNGFYRLKSVTHILWAKDKPRSVSSVLPGLLERAGIAKNNEMQAWAIRVIRNGLDLLVVAPTGSGKTEAALFPILESLGASERGGIRAIYITPLRALNRNLIDRIQRLVASTSLTAAVRHGDTPPSERRKQAVNPPDILITTDRKSVV